jgi:hypothetical protein
MPVQHQLFSPRYRVDDLTDYPRFRDAALFDMDLLGFQLTAAVVQSCSA